MSDLYIRCVKDKKHALLSENSCENADGNFPCADGCPCDLRDSYIALHERYEVMREALDRIIQWSDAYPLDTFPEPDFDAVAKVLNDSGLSLGAVSASNMRHAVKGAANIARSALGDEANE